MKSNMAILTEYVELSIDPAIIAESKDSGAPLILTDRILQKANTKNHNGRIYPKDVLAREVQKYSELVNERRALGELDHPDSPIVELKNVCLLVTKIRLEGDEVRGDIEILNTPQGDILKNLAIQKVKLGISSRGVGSLVSKEGTNIVQDDFELIAFDAVSSPSTPGAYIVESIKRGPDSIDKYNELRKVVYEILGKESYFNKK